MRRYFVHKKIIAIILLVLILFSFSSCGSVIIYEEEQKIVDYVNIMTEGFVPTEESTLTEQYIIYEKEKVLSISLRKGLKTSPTLDITSGNSSKNITENEILTINKKTDNQFELYGKATALSDYFNPYTNSYNSCMQVYNSKDGKNTRILFFIMNDKDDFSPIYYAFSEKAFDKIKKKTEKYIKTQSHSFSEDEIDYLSELEKMYKPYSLYSNEFDSLYGDRFDIDLLKKENAYMLTEVSDEYKVFMESIFPEFCNYTMQSARKEYEKLGYKGEALDIIIAAVDIIINENDEYEINLNENIYYSDIAKDGEYEFVLCPAIS